MSILLYEDGAGSRAPHGARGLKWSVDLNTTPISPSRPARGAWIEIAHVFVILAHLARSRPARGAWIEIPPTWGGYSA